MNKITVVKYGRFVDDKVDCGWDWDCMTIGMHNGFRRAQSAMAKTSGYEYYYKQDGKLVILKEPILVVKIIAYLGFLISFSKKKLVGYRNRCAYE